MDKTKMMAIKAIKPRDYRTFTYKGEPIQVVQSFKYLGINVPSTNRWNECYEFNKNLMEDEYHLLLVCSIDNVIREKYDDLLDGHGNLSDILTEKGHHISACIIFT